LVSAEQFVVDEFGWLILPDGRGRRFMGVRECLVSRPREESGSVSGNRFDFQRDWALCRLFELHESGEDYVLVMEHHDDVIVLDSCEDPTAVDCYQVKTSDSYWSVKDLLRQKTLKNAKANSIVGKMYANCLIFDAATQSVNFVSNYAYRVALKCGSKSDRKESITLNELEPNVAKQVVDQITAEHGVSDPSGFLNLATLIVTNLSLEDHANHAKGKLVAFLDRERPGASLPVGSIYKTLYEELRRRSNYEKQGLDFETILKNKAISRDDFTRYIAGAREVRKIEDDWPTINAQLAAEGLGFVELIQIRQGCREYEMGRMNRRNAVLLSLRDAMRKTVERIRQEGSPTRLSEALEFCVVEVRGLRVIGAEIYRNAYLKAMALFEIYEY
jgi:Cap4 dsDNA endonuclease